MTEFRRPILPYIPVDITEGCDRFEAREKQQARVKGEDLDGEINFLIDVANKLKVFIENAEYGQLSGINDIANKDKFLTTNGEGVQSFSKVQTKHVTPLAITNGLIASGAITADKHSPNSLPEGAFKPKSIGEGPLKDGFLLDRHAADNSFNGSKIKEETLPTSKIKSSPSSVLVTNAEGSSYFKKINNDNEVITRVGNEQVSKPVKDLIAPKTLSHKTIYLEKHPSDLGQGFAVLKNYNNISTLDWASIREEGTWGLSKNLRISAAEPKRLTKYAVFNEKVREKNFGFQNFSFDIGGSKNLGGRVIRDGVYGYHILKLSFATTEMHTYEVVVLGSQNRATEFYRSNTEVHLRFQDGVSALGKFTVIFNEYKF